MEYQNPEIAEGINVSREHPLKELAWLGGGALLLIAVITLALGWIGAHAAKYIPFETEVSLAAKFDFPARTPVTEYLQGLADKLTAAQGMTKSMPITVHYMDDDTINAFATLGGHIVIFRGLLEKLPNENALAMVVAHEIAHIRARHPISGLGRGVAVGLALAALSGLTDSAVMENLLGSAGLLTALHFSRDQEREADKIALNALAAHYGHVQGATTLFDLFIQEARERGESWQPGFLSTHPLSKDRITMIEQLAKAKGWSLKGRTVPLMVIGH
ncbi:MAG: M48 family metalloprotease [Gammaproteobacteria bacterium]|nr:M48 family metalloprotease [Gammaproteobacteria bacterium]